MTVEKIQVTIPGLSVAALAWGPQDAMPVLALHGWLDNAASFELLAPLLSHCRVVAVDLPGHGFSDHLPPTGSYNGIERAVQMFQVADALGWNHFAVIGHSIGGIATQLMAAVMPERITKLVLIDILQIHGR